MDEFAMPVAHCECTCGLTGCQSRGRARGREHGTNSTYNAGCRCDECRSAHVVVRTRQHKRKNAQTLATATKYGQQWTGAELEVAARTDLTIVEIARLLGRSAKAVESMRWRLRYDPKMVAVLGAGREASDRLLRTERA